MRKCFVLLLDLLIFVDRISRFSLAIAGRTRKFRMRLPQELWDVMLMEMKALASKMHVLLAKLPSMK